MNNMNNSYISELSYHPKDEDSHKDNIIKRRDSDILKS